MVHHCHAIHCGTKCKPEFLMCARHWRMVPLAQQRAVYAAYRVGQCDDKRFSGAWLIAADTAIASVAVQEKIWTQEQADAFIAKAKSEAPFFDSR